MVERPGVSGGHEGLIADSTTWVLTRVLDDGSEISVSSDTSINYRNEQVILASTVVEDNISTTDINLYDWGLAVTIEQVLHPGEDV